MSEAIMLRCDNCGHRARYIDGDTIDARVMNFEDNSIIQIDAQGEDYNAECVRYIDDFSVAFKEHHWVKA